MVDDEGTFRSSIKARLIKSFTVAILIPSIVTAAAGVLMIRAQIFDQAQVAVTSDLESAKEIYSNYEDRLKDSLRIHATRMIVYGALERRDPSNLGAEMERIRNAERLDVLTLTDSTGKVFYRTCNPALVGDDQRGDAFVQYVLQKKAPVSSTDIVRREELLKESQKLADQASMEITPTPMAGPPGKKQITSGMMMKGAAPVFTATGRFVGVLVGGMLLNRNYGVVDKIRTTVFKEESYKGREVGTATFFQDDVRISTNVRNADGSRAITTMVSAEVANAVLKRNETWRGRAFVVNDWYISAYAPILSISGDTIGMLYVGTLERPYRDILWKNLYVYLGITLLAMVLISFVAMKVADRISRPIRGMADAARKIADGDYSQKVEVSSDDEIGFLANNFNNMVSELVRAHQELKEWNETLERKVEQRTAELKTVQAHLIQSAKLAGVGKLAAGVAHEINNPLTCVLTNSSLILSDLPPDDPRREDLQAIVDETLRCRKIVKGLLDFARQTKPQKQKLDLNKVAGDVIALVRNQASFQNISIDAELDPGIPSVLADADQMRQVVLNIILNAADAMPQGGKILVRSSFNSKSSRAVLRISDTGPGIPADIQDKMFEPFFTTKKTGTGLGLAIAYGIMERHKGSLIVESSPGRGTTIEVVLPTDIDTIDE
ncbi:MAG: integral rane sensor signal transduction histidine kinase [Acidobacteria bacterium]|nr:integral rane sensor signal transduction histidine kinase [Acidobacteriota bacterium]